VRTELSFKTGFDGYFHYNEVAEAVEEELMKREEVKCPYFVSVRIHNSGLKGKTVSIIAIPAPQDISAIIECYAEGSAFIDEVIEKLDSLSHLFPTTEEKSEFWFKTNNFVDLNFSVLHNSFKSFRFEHTFLGTEGLLYVNLTRKLPLIHMSQVSVPQVPALEVSVPEAPVPEVSVPEVPALEVSVPEVPVPEVPVPEVSVPEVPVPKVYEPLDMVAFLKEAWSVEPELEQEQTVSQVSVPEVSVSKETMVQMDMEVITGVSVEPDSLLGFVPIIQADGKVEHIRDLGWTPEQQVFPEIPYTPKVFLCQFADGSWCYVNEYDMVCSDIYPPMPMYQSQSWY